MQPHPSQALEHLALRCSSMRQVRIVVDAIYLVNETRYHGEPVLWAVGEDEPSGRPDDTGVVLVIGADRPDALRHLVGAMAVLHARSSEDGGGSVGHAPGGRGRLGRWAQAVVNRMLEAVLRRLVPGWHAGGPGA